MDLMKVSGLTMRFSGIIAIENLSFEVAEGSITSLIGPNGAGKTSAFNCLTGFYKPTSGDILFRGESLVNVKPYNITRRGIIRTFQNVRLFRNMTVLENVMSGAHSVSRQGVFGALLRHPAERREEREIRRDAAFFIDYVGIGDRGGKIGRGDDVGADRAILLQQVADRGDLRARLVERGGHDVEERYRMPMRGKELRDALPHQAGADDCDAFACGHGFRHGFNPPSGRRRRT